VDDAGPFLHRHVVPRDDRVLHSFGRRKVIVGALVALADELLALRLGDDFAAERELGQPRLRHPEQAVGGRELHVLGRGIDSRCDVRRQRPRRRRPHDESLPIAVEERQADVERRVAPVLVGADQLVLGDGRPAARAPDVRTVPHVEPAALVHVLQEAPDVLDVRVRERVVVVVPVHPHSEPFGLLRDDLGVLGHGLLALLREGREPVLLDLGLRVEAEHALDVHLDPKALAVEAVLVALVEPLQGLVALKDVLERPAPAVVDAHGVVRSDRAVDEAPARPFGIELAEPVEDLLVLPPIEHLTFEPRMIGYGGKWQEHLRVSLRFRSHGRNDHN
jgi:hypothetical protein